MGEVFAVMGGLAAAVQLCGYARRFSNVLYSFATDAGAAAAEIEHFAKQVRSFSHAIEVAEMALTNYCRDHRESPLVVHMSSRHILADINSEAATVRDHLKAIHAQVKGLKSRWMLLAAIKWTWNKSSILELGPEMESVKASLNLLMVTTLLEHALQRTRSENVSREDMERLHHEMRRHRRMIKADLKTIERLHSQIHGARQSSNEGPYQHLGSAASLQGSLIELGWSMYDDGKVPDLPGISPSIPQDDIHIRFYQPFLGTLDRPQVNQNTTTESSASHSIRRGPRSSRSTNPARELRRVAPRQPPPPPRQNPEPSLPRMPNETQPSIRTIHLPENQLTTRISGYVNMQGGSRLAHPFLVETLDCNIISRNEARKLGLDVEIRDDAESVTFNFGTGTTERSVGRTSLQWTRSTHKDGRPPLTIKCHVCENSDLGLVLGRPFVEERARRWRRSSSGGAGS